MSDLPADILVIDDERQIRRLLNLTLDRRRLPCPRM